MIKNDKVEVRQTKACDISVRTRRSSSGGEIKEWHKTNVDKKEEEEEGGGARKSDSRSLFSLLSFLFSFFLSRPH
jgi:hypothetical protein